MQPSMEALIWVAVTALVIATVAFVWTLTPS
jgi:nitrogen fixation-related uncharacterized protein